MSEKSKELLGIALSMQRETQELQNMRDELTGFMVDQYEQEYLLEDPGKTMTEGFITNLARFVLSARQ